MSQSQTSSPSPAADSNGQALLALKGFTKSFGAVQAMKDVSLDVYPGEVLGLVGDNGAGKSTLIKAIAGAQPADTGEARFDGKQVRLRTPHEATELGIATVYQDLALARTSTWSRISSSGRRCRPRSRGSTSSTRWRWSRRRSSC